MALLLSGPWLPPGISQHARAYDSQFLYTLVAAGIIFTAAQIALIMISVRFAAVETEGHLPKQERSRGLEALWTTATALLFLGLLALGGRVWAGMQFAPAPPGAEEIEVLAKQFAWNFRYPGPDRKFGRIGIRFINDAAGDPFGLDPGDSAGKDDVMTATLRVPAGRPVQLFLESVDVIHSFFVRELRLKQDCVPGMRIPVSFTATVPGTYEIPCAELCGLGHSQMRSTMVVMQADEYARWKRGHGK